MLLSLEVNGIEVGLIINSITQNIPEQPGGDELRLTQILNTMMPCWIKPTKTEYQRKKHWNG